MKKHQVFKRALACVLVVLMTVTAVPMSGFVGLELPKWSQLFATKVSALSSSGKCGENVTYTYNSSTGEVVISGIGEMYGYDDESPFYNSSIKSVVIKDGVTSIGSYTFSYCRDLKSVTIPNSITSIGKYAFSYCSGLTSANISDLTSWCRIDFFSASSNPLCYAKKLYINDNLVTDLEIPESVTSIGIYAFYNCTGLTSVTIPESVTSIGDWAFRNCSGLTQINWNAESVSDFCEDSHVFYGAGLLGMDVVFGDNVKKIPDYIFYVSDSSYRPKIESVTIGNSVISIGDYAFLGCDGLTSIAIPDSVTSIGHSAFENCDGLTSITIPNSVTEIGGSAFFFCTGLKSMTIGNNVKSIGECVFSYCTSLKSIKFTGKPPAFSSGAFSAYYGAIVLYPYGISEWKSTIKSKYGGGFIWVCYHKGTPDSLRIESLPKKTVYYPGEVADYSGLSLTATWSDGFSTVITPDSKIYNISLSGFSTETPGFKTVTATVDGKSVQFKIGVHKANVFTVEKSKYPESAHNYADNLNETKTYKCPDAVNLIVTFSDKTFVEKDGDYIYVNKTKYTGNQLAGKTITISGDTLTVKLVSDSYGNYYGYSIDEIEVTEIEHTNKTTTTKATATKDGKIVTACTVCGNVSKTTPIYKASSIKLSKTSYTYNGKVQKPTVIVKDSKGTTLKNGTDYTVSYSSGCKNTGRYTVTVKFKGNYTGSKPLTFNILPGKTSKLTATQTTSSIKATWKAVTGASGYKVTLYTSKGKAMKTVDATKTTYTFSKLSKGTTYKVRVTAYKTVDGKKVSSSVYTQLTTATNPGAPTLKATAGTKKAALSWNKQTGATGYVVYMATSQNGKYSKIATLKGNSSVTYTKTGLTKGRTYYFKVAAYTVANGKTLYSSFSSVKAVKIK